MWKEKVRYVWIRNLWVLTDRTKSKYRQREWRLCIGWLSILKKVVLFRLIHGFYAVLIKIPASIFFVEIVPVCTYVHLCMYIHKNELRFLTHTTDINQLRWTISLNVKSKYNIFRSKQKRIIFVTLDYARNSWVWHNKHNNNKHNFKN